MKTRLLPKQRKFVKQLVEGKTMAEASRLVGYSESYGTRLAKKAQVMEALDQAGLSDSAMANTLKQTIASGVGIKATNSDAISGLRLAYELKGVLQKDTPDQLTQNNTYINEIRQLDDDGLTQRIEELTQAVEALK